MDLTIEKLQRIEQHANEKIRAAKFDSEPWETYKLAQVCRRAVALQKELDRKLVKELQDSLMMTAIRENLSSAREVLNQKDRDYATMEGFYERAAGRLEDVALVAGIIDSRDQPYTAEQVATQVARKLKERDEKLAASEDRCMNLAEKVYSQEQEIEILNSRIANLRYRLLYNR